MVQAEANQGHVFLIMQDSLAKFIAILKEYHRRNHDVFGICTVPGSKKESVGLRGLPTDKEPFSQKVALFPPFGYSWFMRKNQYYPK